MCARRSAVDFVDQEQIGEDGPAVQSEGAGGEIEDVGAEDVCGHQVRGALHALELQPKHLREHLHGQRLRQPWYTLNERVPADE